MILKKTRHPSPRGGFTGKAVLRPLPRTNCLPYPFPLFVIRYVSCLSPPFCLFPAKKNHEASHPSSDDGLRGLFVNSVNRFVITLPQLRIAIRFLWQYTTMTHLSTTSQVFKHTFIYPDKVFTPLRSLVVLTGPRLPDPQSGPECPQNPRQFHVFF